MLSSCCGGIHVVRVVPVDVQVYGVIGSKAKLALLVVSSRRAIFRCWFLLLPGGDKLTSCCGPIHVVRVLSVVAYCRIPSFSDCSWIPVPMFHSLINQNYYQNLGLKF